MIAHMTVVVMDTNAYSSVSPASCINFFITFERKLLLCNYVSRFGRCSQAYIFVCFPPQKCLQFYLFLQFILFPYIFSIYVQHLIYFIFACIPERSYSQFCDSVVN